eukprot:5079409-Pyramimonas_sp.AAC.1
MRLRASIRQHTALQIASPVQCEQPCTAITSAVCHTFIRPGTGVARQRPEAGTGAAGHISGR